MSDLRQVIVQLVDRGQDFTGAGDFGIGIANDVSRAVVGVLDGALYLILELARMSHVKTKTTKCDFPMMWTCG